MYRTDKIESWEKRGWTTWEGVSAKFIDLLIINTFYIYPWHCQLHTYLEIQTKLKCGTVTGESVWSLSINYLRVFYVICPVAKTNPVIFPIAKTNHCMSANKKSQPLDIPQEPTSKQLDRIPIIYSNLCLNLRFEVCSIKLLLHLLAFTVVCGCRTYPCCIRSLGQYSP